MITAVEEPPPEVIRSRVEDYRGVSAYNESACEKDELLQTCSQKPYGDVQKTLLARNHMLMDIRAFLARAKSDIPDDHEKSIVFLLMRRAGSRRPQTRREP